MTEDIWVYNSCSASAATWLSAVKCDPDAYIVYFVDGRVGFPLMPYAAIYDGNHENLESILANGSRSIQE